MYEIRLIFLKSNVVALSTDSDNITMIYHLKYVDEVDWNV